MKLVMVIVQAEDAAGISDALVEAGLRVTRISTEGGWLRQKNVTLLLGVEDAYIPRALSILKRTAQRRKVLMPVPIHLSMPLGQTTMTTGQETEVEIGGATVFVLNMERLEQY